MALLALAGAAGTASAHNQLVGSNPVAGSSVATAPDTVELTFDQPVQEGQDLNTVVVQGPDGSSQWQGGAAQVKSNVVSAPLRALGPAGKYTIGYRILSADGHSVTGEVEFTLTQAGTGTPAPATAGGTASQSSGSSAPDGGGGIPVWVWVVGAVVLLGGGGFLAARVGSGADK
ncbi:copper resistance protein CopC [Actinokineospora bangkokensis]|uniref:Copper resistance protein CopC n=1 Tax=Actinokineospora bangkokensis TaxID=1193682 RepID=A0A1Q9LU81_9PSEU|nr:copper resistance protein CopC [Actinokineospora bangkokensis]